MTNSDTESLLAPPSDHAATSGDLSFRRRVCRCPAFFVEPVLVLYFFSAFPVSIIVQRYTLDWISDYQRSIDISNLSISVDRLSLSSFRATSGASSSQCPQNGSSADNDFQNQVQSLASLFAIAESLVWGIPAIVSTVFLGTASDRLGRRFCVLPALFGAIASSSSAFFVVWYRAPIFWLFIGDVIYGCCGSFAAMTMSCFAYVADQTPPQRRMIRILVVEMCMLVGGIVSPIGVGGVIDRIGSAYTILVVVCLSAVNFIYVFICLPDSNNRKKSAETDPGQMNGCTGSILDDRRRVAEEGRPISDASDDDVNACLLAESGHRSNDLIINALNDVTNDIPAPIYLNQPNFDSTRSTLISGLRSDVIRSWTTLVGHGGRRWKILVLLGAFFITSLPSFNFSVGTLFEMNHPLCWTINQVGIFSGLSLGVSTVGALIVAPLMKRCMPDIVIAIWAGLSAVATNVYKAFVQTSLMMFISPSLSMFTILLVPSIRSMLSSLVGDDEQGTVFGAIASIEVICFVLGTVIFNSVYSSTLFISSGFVFIIEAIFYVVGTAFLTFYFIRTGRYTLQNNNSSREDVED